MGNAAMNNQGAGGGVQGFGGGQLGQFGNLGGQFGFQGGDQSTILVQLITQVVAEGEWTRSPQVLGGAAAGDPTAFDPGMGFGEAGPLPDDLKNSIGYYSPSSSLVIRATSRFHRNVDSKLNRAPAAAGQFMNAPRRNGDAVALTPKRAAQIVEELKKDPAERDRLALGQNRSRRRRSGRRRWATPATSGPSRPPSSPASISCRRSASSATRPNSSRRRSAKA